MKQWNYTFVTFVPNKLFGQLLDVSPKKLFLNTFNLEFLYIEVWFTDQNSKLMDVENEISITLVITHPATSRCKNVIVASLCTSQWRRRYVSNETPNDGSVEHCQDVSEVLLHDVLLESRGDVSRRRNESHQCFSTTSQTSIKWNTDRLCYGMFPPRLRVRFSRCLVSRSLSHLQVTLIWPSIGRFPCLISVSNQTPSFSGIDWKGNKKSGLDYKTAELLLYLKMVSYIISINNAYCVDTCPY